MATRSNKKQRLRLVRSRSKFSLSLPDGGPTVFCPGDDTFKKFAPKYKSLTADGKTSLPLFHAVPIFQTMAALKSNNGLMNTLATDGTRKFDFTVQNDGEEVTLRTKLVTARVTGTIFNEPPELSIYTLNKVLLPKELFKSDLPLAPAPAPEKSKKKSHASSPASADESADSPSPDGDVANEDSKGNGDMFKWRNGWLLKGLRLKTKVQLAIN